MASRELIAARGFHSDSQALRGTNSLLMQPLQFHLAAFDGDAYQLHRLDPATQVLVRYVVPKIKLHGKMGEDAEKVAGSTAVRTTLKVRHRTLGLTGDWSEYVPMAFSPGGEAAGTQFAELKPAPDAPEGWATTGDTQPLYRLVSGLEPGTTYDLLVSTANGNGDPVGRKHLGVTTRPAALVDAPFTLRATATTITVAWTDPQAVQRLLREFEEIFSRPAASDQTRHQQKRLGKLHNVP